MIDSRTFELCFKPIDKQTLELLIGWHHDAELHRRVDFPTEEWLGYVTDTAGVFAYTVWEGAICVAQVQMDVEDATGSILMAVNPALRGRGYCKRVLEAFIHHHATECLTTLVAYIEPDNEASIRCFASAGFLTQPTDADGFTLMTYQLSKAGS